MRKKRYKKSVLVGIMVGSLLVTGCSKSSDISQQEVITQTQSSTSGSAKDETDATSSETSEGAVTSTTTAITDMEQYLEAEDVVYTKEDEYSEYEKASATTISLEGNTASVNGSGAAVTDGVIRITQAGTYAISGQLTDGQIVVEEDKKGVVRLVLSGVTIHSSKSAPIYIKNAGKIIISLEAGTTNRLTDEIEYEYADVAEDEPNAALFSKDSLTINGTGTLVVESKFNHGIVVKDVLKVMSGTLQVTSVNHGIVGRDALLVKTADITVISGGDGLKTSNDTDATKALLLIEDGTFDIAAGEDAFQSETAMLIKNGSYHLVSGGGSTQSLSDTVSMKGIKTGSVLVIEDGSFVIDSSDDSIHSNNNITINGGAFTLTSGDDGIHADAVLRLSGGEVNITKSYEGIEALTMILAGANINVTASDDGINVAGGQDSSFVGQRPGMNGFSAGNGSLEISGGTITVNSSGDGIDVNGSATMSGGEVYVSGPTDNGNAAFDYDGSFAISGGVLYAVGSAGMAQAPTTDSTQCAILVNLNSSYGENSKIIIKDSAGNVIGEFTAKKQYNSIVYSSPDLILNESYNVYIDEEEVATFRLAQTISTSGEVSMGGFGGFGGGGGQRQDGFGGGGQKPPR